MIYVFDSSTLIHLFRYYYRNRFPSLWSKFDEAIASQEILSVREVLNEVDQGSDTLSEWAKDHRDFFVQSTAEELVFVSKIFAEPQFQALVRNQERMLGKPVADPFVVAKARLLNGCVVTQESRTKTARIPNVCEHFEVECLDLEGFMEKENWTF
jgi:hypothetical protein